MSYIHYTLLIVLCLFVLSAPAQKVHYLCSKTDKSLIAYAIVSTSTDYITTGENGNFTTSSFKNTDSLAIRVLGYENIRLPMNKLPDTIYLQATTQMMNEVVVNANAPKTTVGNFTNKNVVRMVGEAPGIEHAVRLRLRAEDDGRPKKITSVKIRIKKNAHSKPSILHLYEAKEDGSPGRELLTENILITKDDIKGKYCVIDLSEKKVFTNSNGICVGLEYVGKVFTRNNIIQPDTAVDLNYRSIVFETTAYATPATYTRTVFYRDWQLVTFGNPDGGNPTNLMASVTYE